MQEKGQEDIEGSPDSGVKRAREVTTGAQEPRRPRDEAQNSTEAGKQIRSLEGNEPNVVEDVQSTFWQMPLKMGHSCQIDSRQAAHPKVNYLWLC